MIVRQQFVSLASFYNAALHVSYISALISSQSSRTIAMPPSTAQHTSGNTDIMDEPSQGFNKQEIWDRVKHHARKELEILKYAWPVFLFCLFWNYVHAFAHNLAYYFHVPRRSLYDLGFAGLPALDSTLQAVSEYLFFIIITGTVIFALQPFFHDNRKSFELSVSAANGIGAVRNDRIILRNDGFFIWNRQNVAAPPVYLGHMIMRFLTTIAAAQTLRMTCFLITGLPGPNYHCRPFSPFYNPPVTIRELLFRGDVFFSCGDLVFSSHTTFIILAGLMYITYGRMPIMKLVSWLYISLFALLVLCARKHYSIDIFMALYVVPLLWVANASLFPDKFTQLMVDEDIPLPVESVKEAKLNQYKHPRSFSNSNARLTSSFSKDPLEASTPGLPMMSFEPSRPVSNTVILQSHQQDDVLKDLDLAGADIDMDLVDLDIDFDAIDDELTGEGV